MTAGNGHVAAHGRAHNREPGIRCWCGDTHEPTIGPGGEPLTPADEAVLETLARFAEAEQAGTDEKAQFELGPFTAYTLVAILQLAYRHPDLEPGHKKIIREVVGQIAPLFGDAGPVADSIQAGWGEPS